MFAKAMIVIRSKDAHLPSNKEKARSRKSSGVEVVLRKHVADEDMTAPPKKKRRPKARNIIDSDDDDDDTNKAGPSNIVDPRVQPEPSEDTDPGKVSCVAESRFRVNALITDL